MTEAKLKDKLLKILGDDYLIAHRALVYYGKWANELNATGYANLRDALSHLRRFFDPELPLDERAEQLTCAAEHIRRAAIEAYQECFELFFDHASDLYTRYREECIHHEERLGYSGKFDHKYIIAELRRLRKELKEYRRGKDGTNLRPLVKRVIPVCEDVRLLTEKVEECWREYGSRSGGSPEHS